MWAPPNVVCACEFQITKMKMKTNQNCDYEIEIDTLNASVVWVNGLWWLLDMVCVGRCFAALTQFLPCWLYGLDDDDISIV